MSRINHNRISIYRGFTLVEILLAMLIGAILVLGINATYSQAHKLFSSAEDKRPLYHAARLITETLRGELSCAYLPPEANELEDNLFELTYLPSEGTELTFYTLTPSWKGGLESSRPARVRYRFTMNPDAELTLLERFEQPCASEVIIGAETSDVITHNLTDFRVWVVDPNSGSREITWQESFSSKDSLPKACRVSMTFTTDDKATQEEFQTGFFIPTEAALLP